jgi:hypothetical protein
MNKGIAAVAVLALAAGAASGQWSDNFDGYANGTDLHGVGGWKGWDNDPTWTAFVTDDYALSSPHSVEIVADSDLVHEYDADAGQWTYTAWQYIPSSFDGMTYFIMLNNYNDGGDKNWSIQIPFDSATGLMTDDYSGESRTYITDEWVEIRVEIDLDNDFREVYYDGAYFSSWTWTTGVDSLLEIGAVDLFANGASAVYYDDMSLIPAPASVFALLGLAALRRRR